MEEILENTHPPAKEAKPLCPVFKECQGCLYQDIHYPDELKLKEDGLRDLLRARFDIPGETFLPIVPSPKPYYYRNRLDLKLKRTREEGVLIGFTPADRRGVLPVDACFIAEENICAFIPELKKQALARLPAKYRVANLVVRTGDGGHVSWGGIGRRSCELAPRDYFWTQIEGRKIFYSLDTFFQANLSILPEVFRVIASLDCFKAAPVFYDLYGGVGLFGIGLGRIVEQAFLIEENPACLKLARYNRTVNAVDNLTIAGGKVEERLPGLLAKAPGKTKVAMVDPPRAGLSHSACRQIAGVRECGHLLYLSCNPESLARDLGVFLKEGWKIEKIRPFDFFPKTRHLETLAVLAKRP
ncbi:MAG: class I SAM-dependent RNA methyltransferase [Candidatus Omnitrophica bacterium]|nr:class I SAM-dependent RNA methyltransferase [Candidatus Omnitrophota bacterium]